MAALVVALHGYGGAGADIRSWLELGGTGVRVLAPDGPHRAALLPAGFEWFPITADARAMADRARAAAAELEPLLRQEQRAAGVSPGDTAVVGFSQGATVAAALLGSGVARLFAVANGLAVRPHGTRFVPLTEALVLAGERDTFAASARVRASLTELYDLPLTTRFLEIPGTPHALTASTRQAVLPFLSSAREPDHRRHHESCVHAQRGGAAHPR